MESDREVEVSSKKRSRGQAASSGSASKYKAPTRALRKGRVKHGEKADCEGIRVPDGFLYHVVGAEENPIPGKPVRLSVRPGAPACWTTMNVGFFVGRHVGKLLPNVAQYACTKKPGQCSRPVSTRRPGTSTHVWPAYDVDFDDSGLCLLPDMPDDARTNSAPPLLSELYLSLVVFASDHIADIANYLTSDSTDFDTRDHLESSDDFFLNEFLGCGTKDCTASYVLQLESGITTPLLLATHCLILDRDIVNNPGPAKLVDSIPPIMRHDGLPDDATLSRWSDLNRQQCESENQPLLSWGSSTIQFGAARRTLWAVTYLGIPTAHKNYKRSFHDAWIEAAFRVVSMPFVAFLLKRRKVQVELHQMPLADMPHWSRSFEKPLVLLHPLAPKRIFNVCSVLASTMLRTELFSTERPQVCTPFADVAAATCAGARYLRENDSSREATAFVADVCQGVKFHNIMRLESPTLLGSKQNSDFVSYLCSPNAKWTSAVDTRATSFEAWAGEFQTKHAVMPNVTEVLKRVVQYAHGHSLVATAEASVAMHLQASITSLVMPGVISSTSQPHRALVAFGVALRQLCFAYNLLPPVELPSRSLAQSNRSPLPTTKPASSFLDLFLGHDALRPITEAGILGVPKVLVRAEPIALPDLATWTSLTVETGAVWENPSRDWSKVLRIIGNSAQDCTTRLVVLLGGYECPFGFVRSLVAHDPVGASRLDFPSEMDCCGPAILIPAGIWGPCQIAVASFANSSVLYGLQPTDNVLVINALQVLPCVLEYLVVIGRVRRVHMALGAMPPEHLRFARLTPLTSLLVNLAYGHESHDSDEGEKEPCPRRCLEAVGVPANDAIFRRMGGVLFSRSAARLDCANYTTAVLPVPAGAAVSDVRYSPPRLCVAGSIGQVCTLADLLFLPRVVHSCQRHQCLVLVDILMDTPTVKWIDSAWGEFRCVFTKNTNVPTTAGQDQRIIGPTMQRQWMDCFTEEVGNASR